jgi:hypothetical protein
MNDKLSSVSTPSAEEVVKLFWGTVT